MRRPPQLSPGQLMDEATFRRLCRLLGNTGNSERRKRIQGNARARLKALPPSECRALFVRVWEREETKRRRLIASLLYCRYLIWGSSLFSLVVLCGIALYEHSVVPLVLSAPIAFLASILNFGCILLSTPLSGVQRGLARLLLRQESEPGHDDIGYLIEMSEFPWTTEHDIEEVLLGSLRHLTRLLPTLAQTDASLLDAYQKRVLRYWVVRAGHHLTNPKLHTLRGVDADFAASALVALQATGGWEEGTREARAARTALQKLADAPPQTDEPVNHRYVRELAREALPQVQIGKRER